MATHAAVRRPSKGRRAPAAIRRRAQAIRKARNKKATTREKLTIGMVVLVIIGIIITAVIFSGV